MNSASSGQTLIFRLGTARCSLPLHSVVEIFRPLPIEPIKDAPEFVLGLAIVRGEPVPVVDISQLVTGRHGHPARFVVVQTGVRRVALAVDEVVGIRLLEAERLQDLPPLLGGSDSAVVSAIGTLDSELFMVLHASRLIPDGLLERDVTQRLAS